MSEKQKKKYVNSCLERRIQIYPSVTLEKLIIGRGSLKGITKKSEMAIDVIQHYFFHVLNQKDREMYLKEYEKMHPPKK